MNRTQYRVLLSLTALTLAVFLAVAVWRAPAPPVAVPVVRAACEDVYNSVTVKGTVRAARESRVCLASPAHVTAVYAKAGDPVAQGAPLFRVDYDVASEVFSNFHEFPTMFYAETDGTLAQLPAVGDLVLPGVPTARVADFSDLTVEAKVPELYAADLKPGLDANITSVSAPNRTVSATLSTVAPYAVPAFQLTGGTAAATVACTFSLNVPADLLPGSTVDVKLFTDRVKNAVTVPYEAIRQDGTQEFVWVVEAGNTVTRRDVKTGYQLSRGVQVKSGLKAGEWVVKDGEVGLSLGQVVSPNADA